MENGITRPQIAKIWAAAHDLGLDAETLHLLVPQGSIRNLTRAQASDLIEHLCGPGSSPPMQRPARRRRPRHRSAVARRSAVSPRSAAVALPATNEQRYFIGALFQRLGWHRQPKRMRGFLRKFAHVSTIEELRDRKRAIAIIEALKAMVKRRSPRLS